MHGLAALKWVFCRHGVVMLLHLLIVHHRLADVMEVPFYSLKGHVTLHLFSGVLKLSDDTLGIGILSSKTGICNGGIFMGWWLLVVFLRRAGGWWLLVVFLRRAVTLFIA